MASKSNKVDFSLKIYRVFASLRVWLRFEKQCCTLLTKKERMKDEEGTRCDDEMAQDFHCWLLPEWSLLFPKSFWAIGVDLRHLRPVERRTLQREKSPSKHWTGEGPMSVRSDCEIFHYNEWEFGWWLSQKNQGITRFSEWAYSAKKGPQSDSYWECFRAQAVSWKFEGMSGAFLEDKAHPVWWHQRTWSEVPHQAPRNQEECAWSLSSQDGLWWKCEYGRGQRGRLQWRSIWRYERRYLQRQWRALEEY